jgi:hypothetical protein
MFARSITTPMTFGSSLRGDTMPSRRTGYRDWTGMHVFVARREAAYGLRYRA